MANESVMSAEDERRTQLDVALRKRQGFLYTWGRQAWIDIVMSKRMIVDRAWPCR